MDCLEEILDYYEKQIIHKSKKVKTWINSILINLMKDLEEENSNFRSNLKIRNCLILLMNLFFDIEYPKHFYADSKSIFELSNKERNKCIDILKLEFINFN
ncbi:MAG: hypothetical protein ACFFAO_09650 [Candidatus Hermodarchaeota archaeon]